MRLNQRLCMLLIPLALISGGFPSLADAASNSEYFHVSGFATLGLTKSGNEDLGFHRDLDREPLFDGDWTLTADSLAGVQIDFNANDQFGASLQLVGKDRVEDSVENSVKWAFLRYRINPDWTLRAGRLGFDLFMLSEYLDVGFAYLWARPPSEFYTLVTFGSYDGADLAWSTALGEGTLRAKIFTGNSKTTASVQGNILEIEINDIIGGTINWETEHWQLRFSASDNVFGKKNDYFIGTRPLAEALLQVAPFWPEAATMAEGLYITDPHIRYYSLGAAYANSPWQIQSEISYIDSSVELYSSTLSGYLSLGYQIQAFTPYVMIASSQSRNERTPAPAAPVIPFQPELTAQLAALQQYSQTVYDSVNIDQDTVTTGVRWDIRYDLALKLQWDHAWVRAYKPGLWDLRAVPEHDQEIDTFSINLNLIF